MKEALRLAVRNARRGGGPFGAVVVKGERIIGRGSNKVVRNCDPSAHAEILAIRQACRTLQSHSLEGCELYSSCEPCPMCLAAVYWSRIERVWFAATRSDAAAAGFADELLYAELARPVAERRLPLLRIGAEESQIPFREWLNNPDKIPY